MNKFDVVIGNPPYQDGNKVGGDNKIYNQITKKAISLLKTDGILCFITPTSVLKKSVKFSLIGEERIGLKYVDFTSDDYFDVGVNICSWIIDKTYKGNKVKVKSNNGLSEQVSTSPIYDYSKLDEKFIKIYESLKEATDKPEKRMFSYNFSAGQTEKISELQKYLIHKIEDDKKIIVE